jgi:hypothetical protein
LEDFWEVETACVGVLAAEEVGIPKVFDLVLELEFKTELAAAGEDEEACVDID